MGFAILLGLIFMAALSDGYGIVVAIILVLVIGGIYYGSKISTEIKVQNKDPLEVDNTKMMKDVVNGVSTGEINRRYGNGYYDKKR